MKVGERKSKNNRRTGKKKGNDLFALFQVQESQPVKGTGSRTDIDVSNISSTSLRVISKDSQASHQFSSKNSTHYTHITVYM